MARGIWEWENQHLLEIKTGGGGGGDDNGDGDSSDMFPAARVKFNTRAGLRMVDEIARDLLSRGELQEEEDGRGYSDLTQEGTIALMRAMETFDPKPSSSESFEDHARRGIFCAMSLALESSSRGRNAVPVEGTVEIYDPTVDGYATGYSLLSQPSEADDDDNDDADADGTPGGGPTSFADEERYESLTGRDEALLHGGEETEITEEEEEWVEPPDKVVGPLRDLIPDRAEPGPDETAQMDVMRGDVDDLLRNTLDGTELAVIRMRFGISHEGAGEDGDGNGDDDGAGELAYRQGRTFAQIGSRLGISRSRAAQIEAGALEKLRDSHSYAFVEQYLEDDDDPAAEVSL